MEGAYHDVAAPLVSDGPETSLGHGKIKIVVTRTVIRVEKCQVNRCFDMLPSVDSPLHKRHLPLDSCPK